MADDRPRNESGQYADRLPPEDVLDVFDQLDDRARPVTAGDVVDALDVSRRTALNKLNELVAAETLDSRTVGARARVFWRPLPADADERARRLSDEVGEPITVGRTVYEDGDEHPLDAPGRPESGDESTPTAGDRSETETVATPDPTESTVESESAPEDVDTSIDALDLAPDQQAAVAAMRDYLRERGGARKSDFINDVYPEHPAGYETAEGWWNALGTGGTTAASKGALADVDGVKKPERGSRWQWAGEGGEQ